MLGKQVNVGLRHTPFPPYAVNAVYQHHIHFASENGLSNHFQARTVKGQAVALLSGSADNGISCLFRIAAKFESADKAIKDAVTLHNEAEELYYRVEAALKENKKGLDGATKSQIKKDMAALKRLTHAAKPERMTPQLTQELVKAKEALEHSAAGILQEGKA